MSKRGSQTMTYRYHNNGVTAWTGHFAYYDDGQTAWTGHFAYYRNGQTLGPAHMAYEENGQPRDPKKDLVLPLGSGLILIIYEKGFKLSNSC